MTYTPKVNDYVVWDERVEGWVYFKCKDYITIEQYVRPKDPENYQHCNLHRNERLLVLCFRNDWKDLTYIRTRESIYDNEKDYQVQSSV